MPRNMDHKPWLSRKTSKVIELFYEDDKCIIETDEYNYIITNKKIKIGKIKRKKTYINDKDNLLWELCNCRKFFKRDSPEVKTISDLLKRR